LLLVLPPAGAAGCAGPRQTAYSPPPAGPCRGDVPVADGARNFQCASASLELVAAEAGLPLEVRTVVWSHGYPRPLSDHVDYGHARAEGRCLASEVWALRAACPDAEVYLVGHSAGCTVVLAAAECLPPDSVDGIVLLAPAMSCGYDVRPALRCARQGMDVFYSPHDWVYLGLVTGLLGTSDRRWGAVSGRYGFRPRVESAEDAALLVRLRQHPWQPAYAAAGHRGGHYGGYQPEFLRAFVLPLFSRGPCPDGPP
jgi:pimeloyl-ACP methyl ester carboxylesterase